jgi:hypothetical protein
MAAVQPSISIPLRPRADDRIAERFDATMPVYIDGRESVTHDLSTHGLSFESDRPYAPGDRVQVTLDYLMDGHTYPLKWTAIVARCERQGDLFVVGASIVTPVGSATPRETLP